MGLTHYWRRPARLSPDKFRAAVVDVRLLLSTAPVGVAGIDGTGAPILHDDQIAFNGRSPLACESFAIAAIESDRHGGGEVTSFCKTQRLPYDLFVKAVLIVLAHHLQPHFVVTSDEGSDGWASARAFVRETLGYGESFTLWAD